MNSIKKCGIVQFNADGSTLDIETGKSVTVLSKVFAMTGGTSADGLPYYANVEFTYST